MSLHFNLNINIELSYNTSKEIIELFQKKANGQKWSMEYGGQGSCTIRK